MVARPKVLVMDEPTSGLDAASGREVIAAGNFDSYACERECEYSAHSLFCTVKRLAIETNTICIATIHQPNYETFALFDHLLLLAGGQVMFNGPSGRSTLSQETHFQGLTLPLTLQNPSTTISLKLSTLLLLSTPILLTTRFSLSTPNFSTASLA